MKCPFSKKVFKNGCAVLGIAGRAFIKHRALKFSASLAYYTIFSMAPLLILLISLAGIFLGKVAIQGKVTEEIRGLVGKQMSVQVQQLIKQVELSGQATISGIIGFITLLVAAITLFREIQDSINIIYDSKAKPNNNWFKAIREQLWSYLLMLFLGSLFMLSLVGYGMLLALSNKLEVILPHVLVDVFDVINVIISFIVIAVLFGAVYKLLPDLKISWKYVMFGSIFTTLLFMIGRFLIGLYIQKSATGSVYGAAGSLMVILLWVYYSSAILYFGAEVIKAHADYTEGK